MEYFPDYFIALCKDRPSDPDGFVYTVYFVNNTDEAIDRLDIKTGAYATIDETLINLGPSKKTYEKLSPQTYLKIETIDEDAFDFVIWFQASLTKNVSYKILDFYIPKYLLNAKKTTHIPHLKKAGYVFYAM